MSRRAPKVRVRRGSLREEIEQADAFFEELIGGGEETSSDLEAAEEFFAELVGRRPSMPSRGQAASSRPTPRQRRGRASPPTKQRRPAPTTAERAPRSRRVSSDARIRWLQGALARVGVGPVAVDGRIGAQTRGALRRFAQARGLRADDRPLSAVLHRLASATQSVPPGVFAGALPRHRGRMPDLTVPCAQPPTILDGFAFGSSRTTSAHRPQIATIAQAIVASQDSDSPVHWVCLEGHTDNVGAHAQNESLGRRRAESVQDELVAAIDAVRANTSARIGFWSTTAGETQPLAPNTSSQARARNRRVEVRLNRTWRGGHGGGSGVTITARGAAPRPATEAVMLGEQTADYTIPVGRTAGVLATGRPTPGGNPAYRWTSASAAIATVAPAVGTQQHPNQANIRGVAVGRTTVTVNYQPAAGAPSNATVTVEVVPAAGAITRYGCHDLRRGDKDRDPTDANRPRWGGQAGAAASVCTPTPPAPPALPRHVRDLQEDLRTLGFLIVGTPSGVFDRATHWAVREFQIYAKMERVARVRAGVAADLQRGAHEVAADLGYDETSQQSAYVASLEGIANTARYTGRISGTVNEDTREAIDHWIRNRWRCPVVIEAWSMRGGARHRPAAINLWAHDSHPHSAPRMFARDFSGYYTMPAGHNAGDMHVIGDYVTYLTWSGPRSVPPRHTWADAEIMPNNLLGVAAPAGAALSTFRVVRAVSEVECIGFFDSVNCYDNAFVSIGPCHWTLGIVDAAGVFSEGELCGYLAYLRNVDQAAFNSAVGFFGVRVDENWTSAAGPADGADLFSAGQRKYTGWMAAEQEDGSFTRIAETEEEGNYFKTWHWHYRFVMAGRTVDGYRRRMWHMARVRLRDIGNVPWGAGVANVPDGAGGNRAATIADVFTSERARAMLLRWHIRSPAHVISGGAPGRRLRRALATATAAQPTLDWTTDPSTWTNDHEQALIDAIVPSAAPGVRGSLERVRDWPAWLAGANPRGFTLAAPIAAALSADRNSFDFDIAGLPPAPP